MSISQNIECVLWIFLENLNVYFKLHNNVLAMFNSLYHATIQNIDSGNLDIMSLSTVKIIWPLPAFKDEFECINSRYMYIHIRCVYQHCVYILAISPSENSPCALCELLSLTIFRSQNS